MLLLMAYSRASYDRVVSVIPSFVDYVIRAPRRPFCWHRFTTGPYLPLSPLRYSSSSSSSSENERRLLLYWIYCCSTFSLLLFFPLRRPSRAHIFLHPPSSHLSLHFPSLPSHFPFFPFVRDWTMMIHTQEFSPALLLFDRLLVGYSMSTSIGAHGTRHTNNYQVFFLLLLLLLFLFLLVFFVSFVCCCCCWWCFSGPLPNWQHFHEEEEEEEEETLLLFFCCCNWWKDWKEPVCRRRRRRRRRRVSWTIWCTPTSPLASPLVYCQLLHTTATAVSRLDLDLDLDLSPAVSNEKRERKSSAGSFRCSFGFIIFFVCHPFPETNNLFPVIVSPFFSTLTQATRSTTNKNRRKEKGTFIIRTRRVLRYATPSVLALCLLHLSMIACVSTLRRHAGTQARTHVWEERRRHRKRIWREFMWWWYPMACSTLLCSARATRRCSRSSGRRRYNKKKRVVKGGREGQSNNINCWALLRWDERPLLRWLASLIVCGGGGGGGYVPSKDVTVYNLYTFTSSSSSSILSWTAND